MSNKKIIVT